MGKLWDVFRDLKAKGLQVDARGYSASFRVVPRGGKDEEELEVSIATSAASSWPCWQTIGLATTF